MDPMQSQSHTRPKPTIDAFLHRVGVRKNIRVKNESNRKAYVVISPSRIRSIRSIGVEQIGNVEFETFGDYKSQEMILFPGDYKSFILDTSDVYISVLIEVNDREWKEWRYNRLVNSTFNDYIITHDAPDKCTDRSFLDFTRK